MRCTCTGGEPCKDVHGSWCALEGASGLGACQGRARPGKRCDLCEARHSRVATLFRETARIDAAQTQTDLRELNDDVSDSNPSALALETFKMKWKDETQIKDTLYT